MTAIAIKMGTDYDPYFSLLNIMFEELKPFTEDENYDPPVWIKLINDFNGIKLMAKEISEAKTSGAAGKVKNLIFKKFKSKISKAQKFGVAGDSKDSDDFENTMTAAEALNKYREGILGIKKASVSPASAFDLIKEAYAENKESPVFIAKENMEHLIEAITRPYSASFSSQNDMIINLIQDSFKYIWNFAGREANCHIQKLWEEMVLSKTYEISEEKITEFMFGEGGYTTAFINDTIGVFLNKNKVGFYSKRIAGERAPFTSEFLAFITKGDISSKIIRESYQVTIDGMPTDINEEAKVLPHQTLLQLECVSGSQTLKNQNYPVSKAFTWTPKACGDVTLQIYVGNIILTKKYTGHMAFAKFLSDFSKGSHTFYRRDFEKDKSEALRRLGVETVTVKYKLQGHNPVLKLFYMTPKSVPERIVYCALTYCKNNSYCSY